MSENNLLDRLDGLESRFEEISTLITDPAVIADMKRFTKLSKEYRDLEKIHTAGRDYRNLLANIEEAKHTMAKESDEELREMAREMLAEANYR